MTDEKLNELMHDVLIDALRKEWVNTSYTPPSLRPSWKYQREMSAMLRDPSAWYRKKIRPLWKKVLQTAAIFMITVSLAFAALMAASPTVRAAVIQWAEEWYDTHIVYRYSGDAGSEKMPQYEISDLPDGYQEIDRYASPGYVSVTYQSEDGSPVYLDCSFLEQGAASGFVTNQMDVSDITVNGCTGQLFLSQDPSQSSAITWIDEEQNCQFTIDSFSDREGLLHMAESVTER